MNDLERAERAFAAVRAIHSKRTFNDDGYGWSICAEDRQAWPCATERAILDALEPDPDNLHPQ